MSAILELEATIENGNIILDEDDREMLRHRLHGRVRIVVSETAVPDVEVKKVTEGLNDSPPATTSLIELSKEAGYSSFIAYLLDHPLIVDDPTPLTREEIYERSNF